MGFVMSIELPFVVGDIITTYHKGYWRLTEIERRFMQKGDLTLTIHKGAKAGDEYSPLLHYEQVITEDFKSTKGKRKNCCDASLCKKVTPKYIAEMKAKYTEGCDKLLSLVQK
jgi:hypothetical protein